MSSRNLITAATGAALIAGSLLGSGIANASSDPYSSTGTWLVPSEIAPGTYRASLHSGETMGYYATCADYACDIDFDGSDSTGLIENGIVQGPGVVVVPSYAVSIELSGITLTRMS